jgi:antitoxin component YwqK of YwqJK toxin-antitoxin module
MKKLVIVKMFVLLQTNILFAQSLVNEMFSYYSVVKETGPYNNQHSDCRLILENNTFFAEKEIKYSGYIWLRLLDEEKITSYSKEKSAISGFGNVEIDDKTIKVTKKKQRGVYKPWINNKTIENWIEDDIIPVILNYSQILFNVDSVSWTNGINFNPIDPLEKIMSKFNINQEVLGNIINNSYNNWKHDIGDNEYLEMYSNSFIEEDNDYRDLFQCNDFLVEVIDGQITGNLIFMNLNHQKLFSINYLNPTSQLEIYHPLFNTILYKISYENDALKFKVLDNSKTFYEGEFKSNDLLKFSLKEPNGIISHTYEKDKANELLRKYKSGAIEMEISKSENNLINYIKLYDLGILTKFLQFVNYPTDFSNIAYKDGKLQKNENYTKSKLNGTYKEYDTYGRTIIEGQFTDGLKNGIWNYFDYKERYSTEWDYNGILIKNEIEKHREETWDNGLIINTIEK